VRIYGILLRLVIVAVVTYLLLLYVGVVVGYYLPCDLPGLGFGYYEEPC
jgi:hypothetical protein